MKTLGLLLLIFLLAGCRAEPKAAVIPGEVLLRETFDTRVIGWDAATQGNVMIGAADGAYRMQADVRDYVRGFYTATYDNVVIDVIGVQLSAENNNAYGVVCRAAPGDTGNGYYFLIGGDGSYSIREGAQGEIRPLVHWDKTDAVHRGSAENRIRAVCIEDYLALYVNDQFVADIRDDTYQRGRIGFAVAAASGTTIEAAFDDLIIRTGQIQ
ncbi:MAG: hypothetical protein OHK0046_28340 [Anaerolineae bacterium]